MPHNDGAHHACNPYRPPQTDTLTAAEKSEPGCRGVVTVAGAAWLATYALGAAAFIATADRFSTSLDPEIGAVLVFTWLLAGLFVSTVPAAVTGLVYRHLPGRRSRWRWTLTTAFVGAISTVAAVFSIFI